MTSVPNLLIHVGYPKTATSSLQIGLFEQTKLIHYLGRYAPSHRFCDARLYMQLEVLMRGYEREWSSTRNTCSDLLRQWQAHAGDKTTVLSSENFVHPWATDPGLVAKRLFEVAPHAHILLVIREQISIMTSFYRWHGGFGQYLFLNKYVDEPCEFPLTADEWLHYQFIFETKNLIGILDYDGVVADFEEYFGADNVHVLTYETLVTDFDLYMRQLARLLNIPPEECARHLDGVRANSESGQLLERESASKPLAHRFSKENVASVRARFAASNLRLERRRNLGLARLGYAVSADEA